MVVAPPHSSKTRLWVRTQDSLLAYQNSEVKMGGRDVTGAHMPSTMMLTMMSPCEVLPSRVCFDEIDGD